MSTALGGTLAQAHVNGIAIVRWWMFEGEPWQIKTDASGAPTGIEPTVYTDIDAALQLAAPTNVSYDFVLFSAPTALPAAWVTDPSRRLQLASVLAPLFVRYRDNPHVWSWEIFNEPEWDIWDNKIAAASVQATVKAIADSIHRESRTYVTVGSARLDGLSLWTGLGLDYYQAHWYDGMSSGDVCAVCTNYAAVKDRYKLDAPLVIGEFYAGRDSRPLQRYTYFAANGYSGAWPWSLLPDHTSDHMAIDLPAAQAFASGRTDPSSPVAAARTAQETTLKPDFSIATALDSAVVAGGGASTIRVSVTSDASIRALLDVEVYSASGNKVFQKAFDDEAFNASQTRAFAATWQVPPSASSGVYVVKVGVFAPNWGSLYAWNDNAARVSVSGF